MLGIGVVLGGGQAKPFHGFGIVLRQALAVEVHEAQAELRPGLALGGCQSVPLQSLRVALWHALSKRIHFSHEGLAGRIASFGHDAPKLHGRDVVAAFVGVVAVFPLASLHQLRAEQPTGECGNL